MFRRFELRNEAGEGDAGGASLESSESLESNAENLDDAGESEAEQQLTAAEVKKIKKLKLKFNGKEIEEDLPFEIEEAHADWLTKQRQKAMLADHKANEYSQLEREIGAFIQELRKNPKKALSNPAIGLDIKQFAAEILQEEIEQAQKTPEQIKEEALQRELEELKAERAREKEEMNARELERLTEREYERYDNLMSAAIESSDLPKSPYVVKKMTEYLMMGIENGIDVEPKDVIPLIREEIQNDIQEMFQVMPAEVIEQILGKSNIEKLRKKRVASAKAPVPVKASVKDVGAQKKEEVKEEKKQTLRDFFGV
jgi:hypothetical protein